MKLEFKHIACYVPYGLNIIKSDSDIGITKYVLIGILNDGGAIRYADRTDDDPDFTIVVSKSEKERYPTYYHYHLWRGYKLILHPLSDLRKETDQSGEKFIPIDEIINLDRNGLFTFYRISTGDVSEFLNDVSNFNTVNPARLSYMVIQKLFEWHFDIFGLIKKGFAIDINSLKN